MARCLLGGAMFGKGPQIESKRSVQLRDGCLRGLSSPLPYRLIAW